MNMVRFPLSLALVFGLVAGCGPVAASSLASKHREENDVWLTGPITSQVAPPLSEGGDAMVCGMRARTSTLSVRVAPGAQARELAQLPYYATVRMTGRMTGDIAADTGWVEIEGYVLAFDTMGRMRDPDAPQTALRGWVSMRYLCAFVA